MIPKNRDQWPEADFFVTNEDKDFIVSKVIPMFDGWDYARAKSGLKFAQEMIYRFGTIDLRVS